MEPDGSEDETVDGHWERMNDWRISEMMHLMPGPSNTVWTGATFTMTYAVYYSNYYEYFFLLKAFSDLYNKYSEINTLF